MHSRLPRGVRPRLEGNPRTPLSSLVATRVSWSRLSGLKGVQPPLPFGERNRDAADYAHVVEKRATALVDGETIALFDENGEPLMYKTVDPVLTDELTDDQRKALSVIKKGRDGFEVKPYDKLRALELLGRHLGMWDKKEDTGGDEVQNDGFLDALRGETQSVCRRSHGQRPAHGSLCPWESCFHRML